MRWLGRVLLPLTAAAVVWWLIPALTGTLYWDELAATLGGRMADAQRSTGYLVRDDGWLEYRVGSDAEALRVRSNLVLSAAVEPGASVADANVSDADVPDTDVPDADVPDGNEADGGEAWWYAFDYQLVDADGVVLRAASYHHRTQRTAAVGRDERVAGRNFFLDPGLASADGRSMVLDFSVLPRPVLLRIRPQRMAPELRGVLFRVYQKTSHPDAELPVRWQRLSRGVRERLADLSVLGLDLLRPQEKYNLVRTRWSALGPLGVEGQEYDTLRLYIVREQDTEVIAAELPPAGLRCGPELRAVVPLPPGDWALSLQIATLAAVNAASAPRLTVDWQGRDLAGSWREELVAGADEQPLAHRAQGGVLEIAATAAVAVRVWGTTAGERREFTPQPLRLRTYAVSPEQPLAVSVDHVGAHATPFRVDVRSRLAPGVARTQQRLHYRLLAGDDAELAAGTLRLELEPSPYDRIDGVDGGRVSAPLSHYFALPKAVRRVEFSAPGELLLATYTRPPGLPRVVRIPEDRERAEVDDTGPPAWFLLRPRDEARWRRELRSPMLSLQPQPPQPDPRWLAGDYDWTALRPEGNWRARRLLVPRDAGAPLRDSARHAVYRPLATGVAVPLRWRSAPGRVPRPELIFRRAEAAPLAARLTLDGRVHDELRLVGRVGRWRLPPLPAAAATQVARVRIDAEAPVQWFINQAEFAAPEYQVRLAARVPVAGLSFPYRKESAAAEPLSGAVYVAAGARMGLQVRILGPAATGAGPQRDWTFRDRRYNLRIDPGAPIVVLDGTTPALAGGQRFVVPLGADLPPGDYRIELRVADGTEVATEAYATLARLTPGQSASRALFREDLDAPVAGD